MLCRNPIRSLHFFQCDSKLQELKNQLEENEKISNDVKKKYSSTKDELDCTNMKLDTLMSSLQCLQDERDTLSVTVEETKSNVVTATEKLTLSENEKLELTDRLKDNEQQISGLKDHIKSMTGKLQSSDRLAKDNANLKNEIAALNITVSTLKQTKGQTDAGSSDTNKMKAIIVELKKRLKGQCETNEDFKKKLSTVEAVNETYQSEISDVKAKLEHSASFYSNLEEKLGFKMDEFYESYSSLKSDFEISQDGIEDLKIAVELHSTRASSLSQDLDKLTAEKEQLVNKLHSMEGCVEKSNGLAAENEVVKGKVVELEKLLNEATPSNDLQTLEKQVEELKENNSKLSKDIEHAEEKYKKTYDECADSLSTQKQNMTVLEEEKEKLEMRLEHVENDLKEAMSQAADTQQKLQHDIQSVKDDNARIVEENVDLKATLMRMRHEKESHESKMRELDQDKIDLSQKLVQLENELSSRGEFIKESTERIRNLEIDNAALEEKLKMLKEGAEIQNVIQQEIDHLKEERDALHVEKGQLDSQVKEYESNMKIFESEIDELRKNSSEKLDSLSDLNLSLRNELDAKIQSINDVENRLDSAEKKCKETEDALTLANDTVMSLNDSLKEANMECHKEKSEKEALEKEVISVKESLSSAQSKIDTFMNREAENSSVVADLEAMKRKFDELTHDFELSSQEQERRKKEYNELDSEFLKSKESCADLENVVAEKEKEMCDVKDELENAVLLIKEGDDKMNEYVNKIECLQKEKEKLEDDLKLIRNRLENRESDKASEEETARIDEISDEKDKLDAEILNLRESMEIKDKDLADLKAEIEAAEQNFTEQLQTKDTKIAAEIGKSNELESAVMEFEERLRQQEKDYNIAITEKDSELEMKREEFDESLKKIQENEKVQESLLEKITDLQNSLTEKDLSAQNQYDKFSEDLGKLENRNEELRKEVEIKIEELQEKVCVIKEKDANIAELESKIEASELQLHTATAGFQKSSLEEKEANDSIVAEIDGLKHEVSRLRQEKSDLETHFEAENSKWIDGINVMVKEKEELIKRNDVLVDDLKKSNVATDDYEKKMLRETQIRNAAESKLLVLEEKFQELSQQRETEAKQVRYYLLHKWGFFKIFRNVLLLTLKKKFCPYKNMRYWNFF